MREKERGERRRSRAADGCSLESLFLFSFKNQQPGSSSHQPLLEPVKQSQAQACYRSGLESVCVIWGESERRRREKEDERGSRDMRQCRKTNFCEHGRACSPPYHSATTRRGRRVLAEHLCTKKGLAAALSLLTVARSLVSHIVSMSKKKTDAPTRKTPLSLLSSSTLVSARKGSLEKGGSALVALGAKRE